MSVFTRRASQQAEYRLYAKGSDAVSTLSNNVQMLTEDDFIDTSNCTYQCIYESKRDPPIQEHVKAGLLFCQDGYKIETSQIDRLDTKGRHMFLIPCEAGLDYHQYNPDTMQWRSSYTNITPSHYVHLRWDVDQLFTTALGKAIQLKVVDQRPPDAAHQTLAMKRGRDAAPQYALADMYTLLHQMKLTSNKV